MGRGLIIKAPSFRPSPSLPLPRIFRFLLPSLPIVSVIPSCSFSLSHDLTISFLLTVMSPNLRGKTVSAQDWTGNSLWLELMWRPLHHINASVILKLKFNYVGTNENENLSAWDRTGDLLCLRVRVRVQVQTSTCTSTCVCTNTYRHIRKAYCQSVMLETKL